MQGRQSVYDCRLLTLYVFQNGHKFHILWTFLKHLIRCKTVDSFFPIIYGQSLDTQLLPEGWYKNQNFRPKHVKELHFCQSFISGVKGTTDGRLFIQLFKYLFIENSCTWCALRQSIVRSKFCRGEQTKTKEEQEDRCLYYTFLDQIEDQTPEQKGSC